MARSGAAALVGANLLSCFSFLRSGVGTLRHSARRCAAEAGYFLLRGQEKVTKEKAALAGANRCGIWHSN